MTAAERLDAIAARAESATPGPWTLYKVDGRPERLGIDDPEEGSIFVDNSYGLTYAVNPADARLTAHARTDIPALVAALRAVLAVCDEIEPNTFGDSLIAADDIIRAITTALDVTP